MRIVIMRHADARSRVESGVGYDAERPLSERGCRDASAAGRLLSVAGFRPVRAISSPLVRAQQTAAAVCEAVGGDPRLTPVALLAPGSGPEELLRAAANHSPTDDGWLLAVMHEPDVGHILGALLATGDGFPLNVRPGDLYALEVEAKAGVCVTKLALVYSPSALA